MAMRLGSAMLLAMCVGAVRCHDDSSLEALLKLTEDGRGAQTQGASPERFNMWPGGVINWVYYHLPVNDIPPLDDEDPRIPAAIEEWESKSCIRFKQCTKVWNECPRPIYVILPDPGGCSSTVGHVTENQYAVMRLADACGVAAVVHEFGHGLGLNHEQQRRDRDRFVNVNLTAAMPNRLHNFDKNTDRSFDLGRYDYNSIMHYGPNGFRNGVQPTIISPYPIGQRVGLSSGDLAAVDFLYNGCSDEYPNGPRCVASVDESEVQLIPHSRPWVVDFNVKNTEGDAVLAEYQTTAENVVFSPADGSVGIVNYVTANFTPTPEMAGQTFEFTSIFSGNISGNTSQCSVKVKVANASRVCVGLEEHDPNVCSGRGKCVDIPGVICECEPGWVSADCSMKDTCPGNEMVDFDDEEKPFEIEGASIDTKIKATRYGASLKLDDVDADVPLERHWIPRRVSAFLAGEDCGLKVEFRNESHMCMSASVDDGVWWVGGERTTVVFEPHRFYFFDFFVTSSRGTGEVFINGRFAGRSPLCEAGYNTLRLEGSGWLDQWHTSCDNYLVLEGPQQFTATEEDLRTGPARSRLRLSLLSAQDLWVDSPANGDLVKEMLVSARPSTTGWQEEGAAALGNMTVVSNVLADFPLIGNENYASDATERVVFKPTHGMFREGNPPTQPDEESTFRVIGKCHEHLARGFNTEEELAGLPSDRTDLSEKVKSKGAGSLELTSANEASEVPVAETRPETFTVQVRREEAGAEVVFSLVTEKGTVSVDLAYGKNDTLMVRQSAKSGFAAVFAGDEKAAVGKFEEVKANFNWENRTFTVQLNGGDESSALELPADMLYIEGVRMVATAVPAYVDELVLPCKERKPVYTLERVNGGSKAKAKAKAGEFGEAGTGDKEAIDTTVRRLAAATRGVAWGRPVEDGLRAISLTVHPGSYALSQTDKMAIVHKWAHCGALSTKKGTLCAGLACSDTHGVKRMYMDTMTWETGHIRGLDEHVEVKVCYYSKTVGAFKQLGFLREYDACHKTPDCCPPATHCFEKNKWFAQCIRECVPGSPGFRGWSCAKLGEGAPQTPVPVACPVVPLVKYDNCHDAPMCCPKGTRCYEKDDFYAQCRTVCKKSDGWSCQVLG